MTTKHTPTPWTYDNATNSYVIYEQSMQDAEEYGTIAAYATTEANAAFIIKAVNCHDELVANIQDAHDALKDIINAAGNNQPYSGAELASEFTGIVDNLLYCLDKLK